MRVRRTKLLGVGGNERVPSGKVEKEGRKGSNQVASEFWERLDPEIHLSNLHAIFVNLDCQIHTTVSCVVMLLLLLLQLLLSSGPARSFNLSTYSVNVRRSTTFTPKNIHTYTPIFFF